VLWGMRNVTLLRPDGPKLGASLFRLLFIIY